MKTLCIHIKTEKTRNCETCCGATNSCGLYESEVNPFNHSRQTKPKSLEDESISRREQETTSEAFEKDKSADTYSRRKEESKALSSCSLETRSIPDKDTIQKEGLRGLYDLNCGNHADAHQQASSDVTLQTLFHPVGVYADGYMRVMK